MSVSQKSKMAAATILFLEKNLWWFRNTFYTTERHSASATKCDKNQPIHVAGMGLWWNSKWQQQPSWILVIWHFWSYDPFYGAIVYLHTKFEPNPTFADEVVMTIFSQIQDGGRPPFSNCRINYSVLVILTFSFSSEMAWNAWPRPLSNVLGGIWPPPL